MNKQIIDLSSFKRDDSFYQETSLLLTVKSFDLQAIRARYLESRKRGGPTGSVERREAGLGGICLVRFKEGKVLEEKILAKMKEPRAISQFENNLGLAAENVVYILNAGRIRKIENPWFSYIHTVDFRRDGHPGVLITSSGLDCIFEYDQESGHPLREWFAWENGFYEAKDPESGRPVRLTRNSETARLWKNEGHDVTLISDPKEQHLPTAKRAAFINSVVYNRHNPDEMLATFFHKGSVFKINLNTGQAELVLNDLLNPHGGNNFGLHFMATSTASGEVVTGEMERQIRYQFKNLPEKDPALGEREWLQNTILSGNNFITIDSNRTAFVIFCPEKRLYSLVPYNNNWAVQDMIEAQLSQQQMLAIESLSE